MLTDVQIINLGLSKIAASRISRIDPAQTPLEKYMASNYPQWRRSELTKRRWVFAMVSGYALTVSEILESDTTDQIYKYPMPIDCLRPIRTKRTEWVQRGRFIYSAYDDLEIDYIKNAPESDFDTLFNDVLAARIGYESCEYVTQSSTKRAAAKAEYEDAVAIAGNLNAFIIGPEDIGDADDAADFTWLGVRNYG